jgi:hypothetical protein
LSRREDILRFSGAVGRDPAVDAWLTDGPVELRSIAQKWFAQMRECGDDSTSVFSMEPHWETPLAC